MHTRQKVQACLFQLNNHCMLCLSGYRWIVTNVCCSQKLNVPLAWQAGNPLKLFFFCFFCCRILDRPYGLRVRAVDLFHHIFVQTRLEEGCWRGAHLHLLTVYHTFIHQSMSLTVVSDQAKVRAGVRVKEEKDTIKMENRGEWANWLKHSRYYSVLLILLFLNPRI